jgi:hypothetical protein
MKKLRDKAISNLGLNPDDTFTSQQEYYITDEMLAIAKKAALKANPSIDLDAKQQEAELALNIREGRTTSYDGIGNATPILGNLGGKK